MPPIRTDTSDDGLREAIQADLETSNLRLLPVPGAEAIDVPELGLRRASIPVRESNGIYRTRFEGGDADRRIDGIVDSFREHRLPFHWWVGPFDRPTDLDDRLATRGLTIVRDAIPGMARDLHGLEPMHELTGRVRVEPVLDAAGLGRYLGVIRATIGAEEGPRAVRQRAAREAAVRELVRRVGYAEWGVPVRWIGWLDDACVGTGRLSAAAGVAGLYGIGTLPEARRHGVATAIIGSILTTAREAGLRIAALQASDEAVGLYERLGFRTLLTWRVRGWQPDGTIAT